MSILFIHQAHSAQTYPMAFRRDCRAVAYHIRIEVIKHRIAPAVGHPAHRILYFHRNLHTVDTRFQYYCFSGFHYRFAIQRCHDHNLRTGIVRRHAVYLQLIGHNGQTVGERNLLHVIVGDACLIVKADADRPPDTACGHTYAPVPSVAVRSLTGEHTEFLVMMVIVCRIVKTV